MHYSQSVTPSNYISDLFILVAFKWNETKFLLFVVNCPFLYDLPHKYADWNPLYNGGNMCIYIIWVIFSPTRMGLFWINIVEYIIWDYGSIGWDNLMHNIFNIQSYFYNSKSMFFSKLFAYHTNCCHCIVSRSTHAMDLEFGRLQLARIALSDDPSLVFLRKSCQFNKNIVHDSTGIYPLGIDSYFFR